jgi:hypothetical protein
MIQQQKPEEVNMSDRNPLAYTGRISGSTKVQGDVQFNSSQFKVNDGVVQMTNTLQFADVTLTSSEIKNARATPLELVAAQGAGNTVMFFGAQLKLNYGGTNAFTETNDNFAVKYTNGSGDAVSQDIETTGFINQTADTLTNALPVNDAIVAASSSENQPLVLHNIGTSEIAGNAANDNTIALRIFYQVIAL